MNKRAEAGGPSNRVLILTGAWLCFPPLWRVFRHGAHFRCRRVSFSDFDSQQSDQKAKAHRRRNFVERMFWLIKDGRRIAHDTTNWPETSFQLQQPESFGGPDCPNLNPPDWRAFSRIAFLRTRGMPGAEVKDRSPCRSEFRRFGRSVLASCRGAASRLDAKAHRHARRTGSPGRPDRGNQTDDSAGVPASRLLCDTLPLWRRLSKWFALPASRAHLGRLLRRWTATAAVAEMAFYRLLFFADIQRPYNDAAEYTAFSAEVATERLLDLTHEPFSR